MPRIRTVKPELFRHEMLFEMERIHGLPIRLGFIGLLLCVDKEGRFRWRPRQLKLDIFPYDDLDMESLLNALVEGGFVVKYAHETEIYGCIPSWKKHQKINFRELKSVIPPCEKNNLFTEEKENSLPNPCDDSVVNAIETITPFDLEEIKKEDDTTSIILHAASSTDPAVTTVFEHWKKVTGYLNAQLDSKRIASIQKALQTGYTITQLFEAIEGCRCTPHNMGVNEQGQRYDGLHIIFRDADQIDRFIHNFHQPPRPMNDAEKRMHSNVQTLQTWLDKKMQSEEE